MDNFLHYVDDMLINFSRKIAAEHPERVSMIYKDVPLNYNGYADLVLNARRVYVSSLENGLHNHNYKDLLSGKQSSFLYPTSRRHGFYDYTTRGLEKLHFCSFSKNEDILLADNFRGRIFLRLLEVETPLVLPYGCHLKLSVTSADVIHSWAVPSLGIKVDAIPGRINQQALLINRPGVYMGQCSELCGVLHSFMPINIEAIDPIDFYDNYVFTLTSAEEGLCH